MTAILLASADLMPCVAYVAGLFPLAAYSWHLFRTRDESSVVLAAAFINGIAIVSVACLLIFQFSGAATTVQLNAGDERTMSVWSLWVSAWPLLLLALFVGIGTTLLCAVIVLVERFRRAALKSAWKELGYVAATHLHCWIALVWIAGNFPDA